MTVTDTSGHGAPLTITRDRDGLLAALSAIDDEGWDGPTATRLLTFVRRRSLGHW